MLSPSTLLKPAGVFCIALSSVMVLIATKERYQAWYALHDSAWSEIEAGDSAISQRNFAIAESHLKRALVKATAFESQRINLPFPRPGLRDSIMFCLGDLGKVYEQQGKYPEAKDFYQLRLTRSERINGEDSFATKCCLISLLGVYEVQGNYDKAEPIFRRIRNRFSHPLQGTPDLAQDSRLMEEYSRFLRRVEHEDEAVTLERELQRSKKIEQQAIQN